MTLKSGFTCFAVCGLLVFWLFLPSFSFAASPSIGLLDSIKSALGHQYDIESSKLDVQSSEDALQETSGQFDTSFQATAAHGITRTSPEYTESDYRVGLSRQLRNGVELSTSLETTRTAVPSYTTESSTSAYLVASLPLLRGLGADVVAGLETAARQDAEASRIELQHSISGVVYDTSLAYWKYVLDYLFLKQYREAEQRAEMMYEQTRSLVAVDELTSADLDESRANLSDKQTARLGVEEDCIESRQALGMAMGIPFDQIRILPPPGDDFSLVELKRDLLSQIDSTALIGDAVRARHDLKASRMYEKSFASREKVVADQLRPKVNLGIQVGYEGLKEGDDYRNMGDSLAYGVDGVSWQVSLSYEFSVENRTALGQLGQQRQEKRRQELKTRELIRSIQSSVHKTLSVLRQNIMEFENAQKTVELYEKAVANKLMAFRLGMGTQLDLINTEDNLTQARLSRIKAHYKGAIALSQLRYQTASLVSFIEDQAHVDLESLTSLPRAIPHPDEAGH